ncbi:MAG: LPS export ABC transporter permease LptF [Gammaproteobacteria bacterium]
MILRRYLLREVLYAALGVLAVLLLVYISHRFVRLLSAASAGSISGDLVVQLVLLNLGSAMQLLLPLALYGGVLLGMGRLYRDSEIVAMSAGGFGLRRFVSTVCIVGLVGAVVVGVLALVVTPRIAALQEYVLARAKGEALITGLVPGRFQTFGGDSVVYAQRVDAGERVLGGVFVQAQTERGQQLLLAGRAYPKVDPDSGDRFVVLTHGTRYAGEPGRRDFVVTEFAEHAVRLDRIRRPAVRARLEAEHSSALFGTGEASKLAELQWRFSMPISAMLLPVLALALARTTARQGRFARLFLAAVIYFAYNNALGIAQSLTERGEWPAAVGLWPVHAAVLVAALWLLARMARGHRRRQPLVPATAAP